MSSTFWIPYLTDNIYRLTGLGTHSDITQLRQAVRKIESGMRVGITPKVPFADLVGDTELPNLPNILQQVSSDTVKYICHKLMWFPVWETELITAHNPLDACYEIMCRFDKGQPEHEHLAFLRELVRFIQTGNPNDLEKCIQKIHNIYKNEEFVLYVDRMIKQDDFRSTVERNDLIEVVKFNIAAGLLEYSLSVAIHYLSDGDFDRGKSILEVIVDSPLEDDWEDKVLSRVQEYVSPILSRIRETTERTEHWRFEYEDPYQRESEQISALVSLLRGRVSGVIEWEKVLQDWIDKRVLLVCGEAIAKVGGLLERAKSTKYLGKTEKISLLNELHSLLAEVERVIQASLRMKVSQRVRAYLLENLQAAREIRDQLPSAADVERAERSRGKSVLTVIGITLFILLIIARIYTDTIGSQPINAGDGSSDIHVQDNLPIPSHTPPTLTGNTTSNKLAGAESLFEKADKLYYNRKYSQAAIAYLTAIRTARQRAEAIPIHMYYRYGVCCEKSKRRSDAIWAYTTYIQNSQYGDKFNEAVAALKRLGVVSRPKSGASPLGGGIRAGYSKVILVNRSQNDAFVELLAYDNNQLTRVRNVYVRSGSRITVSRVPTGQYIISVSYGKLWDKNNKKFLINSSFSQSDMFVVEERYWGYSVEYSIITFLLDESAENNFIL